MYSKGSNSKGELGLGDFYQRDTPHLIESLRNSNDKVIEFSVGYKHVICKSALNKVFVWGSNKFSQLGLGDRYDRSIPEVLKIPSLKTYRY